MAPALLCSPSKMRQTLALQRSLKGIPTHFGTWPVKAEGTERLMTVHLRSTAGTQAFPCDMLACGFHLLPNTELAQALGCTISHGAVHVNEHLATSRPGIYAAGETLGIGGVECAIIEGAIAGYAACSNTRAAQSLLPQRHRARRFANTLNRAFSLRQELRTLCDSDTVLCRCEDVRYRDLSGFTDWRSAKLNTRCGMGACQGRVCGSINQFLFGWEPPAIRTPISSTPIQTLADGFSALNSPTTTNNEKNIP